MQSKYDEPLAEIMSLIVGKAPKSKIITRAKEIKIEITTAWSDAQQAIAFLDQMINRYSPDMEYPQGFLFQNPPQVVIRPGTAITPTPMRVSVIADATHILELTKKLASDGVIETKSIINQLRTEGDQRPDRDMSKSIGNILARNGWKWVGTGKYQLSEQKDTKEE